MTSCAKTITETKIEYIHPDIPASLLESCEQIKNDSITTNGDLLMSYISLQTAYAICSSKIVSIRNILDSYNTVYSTDNN